VLPFLEARSYLHGTTLFDAIVKTLPVKSSISFSISKQIDTDRVCIIRRAVSDPPDRDISARLVWRSKSSSGALGVAALPPSPKPQTDTYIEELVSQNLAHADGSVSLLKPSPFTFVATLIPAYKALLSQTKMRSLGKWMFTRLDLEHHPEDFVPLKLSLDMIVADKLARSAVEVNGTRIGLLYFSWIQST
jgi:hypothetical protein